MGQLAQVSISLSNQAVGRVQVDPATIRGEGGIHDARLVVPVLMEMSPQPIEEHLCVIRLSGSLHMDYTALPPSRTGLPDSQDLVYNMPIRSLLHESTLNTVELRFPLSMPVIEKLERHRHGSPEREALLYLRLEPTLVLLRTTHGNVPVSAVPQAEVGQNHAARFGLLSEMSIFWLPKIEVLRLVIDTSQWVDNVLPGLGYDRVRLVELTLPPSLPPGVNAEARFAAFRQALDSGRYDDAVAASRDILRAWSGYLEASKQKPVATVVGKRLAWPEGDPRRSLLDALWKGLTDVANTPHHPEGQTQPFAPSAADARLQLLLSAALSEYLSDVLDVS